MIKKIARETRRSFASLRRRGWKSAGPVFLAMFLAGYGVTASSVRQSHAQFIPVPPAPAVAGSVGCPCNSMMVCVACGTVVCCHCHVDPAIDSCVSSGTSNTLATWLANALQTCLTAAQLALVGFIDATDTALTEAMLTRIEYDFIYWWQTMWYYNLKPSLQNMVDQLNVSYAGQSLALHDAIDATATAENVLSLQKRGLEDHRNLRPSDNTCVAATESGGLGRATMFARAMRKGWQDESLVYGLNTQGMNVLSMGQTEARRYAAYKAIFCDPNANGGHNGLCTAINPVYFNADVQPTKFIYNNLTIDMDPVDDPLGEMARTVETINSNLVGVPSADVILPGALGSASGQALFLDRRSYLARHGAIRSVPQLITGWRVPGGGRDPLTGQWVKELRTAGGASATDLSENPSYKEIMHAMTVDRFNSGRYAAGLIINESAIELEKLTLDALYLMQLRDYYELLERTALTLAVQVSIMSEQVAVPSSRVVTPLTP
ncbi:MAG: hypothetical protein V1721_05910 [Pseudomonadota bacterium]